MFQSVMPDKKAKAYQLTWSISVVLIITLSLTLPFACFIVASFFEEKIAIEVGLLKCFSDICSQNPIEGESKIWNQDWEEFIPDAMTKNLKDFITPRFVRWAKVGSIGTIVFFMLAGLAMLLQIVSLIAGGREVESYMQDLCAMCRNDPTDMLTSRILVTGSIFLLLGVLWYPLVTFTVLNGGKYIYGFWVSLLTAVVSLVFSLIACRDKTAWSYLKGFSYEPIPSRVELEGEVYHFPGYRTP